VHLFLSYASENRARAEEIALALKADGHDVFFDSAKLVGGENYHQVIREQIAEADLLLFLISPHSVEPGSYTLTELRMAEDRWDSPAGHVVPVLIERTAMEAIPAYLRAVTIFEPKGNAAAEIAAHVNRLRGRRRPRLWMAAAVVLVTVAVVFAVWIHGRTNSAGTGKPFMPTIAESDFVSDFVMPPDAIERTEYTLDPTARFPTDRGDVVRLERLAFGELSDGSSAFSARVSVNNVTDQPIHLDLTPRFFELADDHGRKAELLFFCCEAKGATLSPGQQRQIQLIYRSAPGWEGKETTPAMIHLRISGLLPVVRATWSFRPLATAA
jgi:hypothetical protein